MQAARFVALAIAAWALAAPGMGAFRPAAAQPGDSARAKAEALADAATREFTAVMERRRLAQAQAPKSDPPAGSAGDPAEEGPLGWWRRSSRQFQTLMRMLAGERQPPDSVADTEKAPDKSGKTDAAAADVARTAGEAKQAADAKAAAAEAKRAADAKAADEARKAAEARQAAEAKAADDASKAAEAKQAAEAKAAEDEAGRRCEGSRGRAEGGRGQAGGRCESR
jgi:hypothetical protein